MGSNILLHVWFLLHESQTCKNCISLSLRFTHLLISFGKPNESIVFWVRFYYKLCINMYWTIICLTNNRSRVYYLEHDLL